MDIKENCFLKTFFYPCFFLKNVNFLKMENPLTYPQTLFEGTVMQI